MQMYKRNKKSEVEELRKKLIMLYEYCTRPARQASGREVSASE